MGIISVIATVHRDNGAADSEALADILKLVSPDVIFLETPPGQMEHYFSKETLESRAIQILSKHQPIDLIPVDIHVMDKAEMLIFDRLFDFLENYGVEVARSIHERIYSSTRSQGFSFLNSTDYIESQSGLERLDDHIVETKGDEIIQGLYEKWKEAQASREHAMIANIAYYCKSQNFDHAVFLIGAAHIRSLRGMIERSKGDFIDTEWRFSV
ncbi:hypothetical protein A15D_01551 [Alcanivorax sp. MD8A]|uniref:hypothetical protein n=1 Tax=Alcanivorax sp. MD8A TaxID=1177157 RepID=UPI000C9C8F7A|nr:hypothetical protein [Alcanivorax sp. MD8A]PNE02942.1 hypothetical protein A15D_01551 [Alcanivorax sp. MD8A]